MKHLQIFIIFIFSALCVNAQEIGQIKDFLAQHPALKNAQYSVYAKYEGGGEIISVNPKARLTPASVLKLYTTAAALDILGADYTFDTKIYYDGEKDDSVIDGDVFIQGGGDPTLGSYRLPLNPDFDTLLDGWAGVLKLAGIEKIKGRICADNTLFSGVLLPARTTYRNIGNYFAAPVDALSIRDNSYEIYFEPSLADGQTAKVLKTVPEVKGFDIISRVTFSKDIKTDEAYVNFIPVQNAVEVYGTLPLSDNPQKIYAALPYPALFLAQAFKDKLQAADIKVKGEAALCSAESYQNKTLLLTHKSPKLADIINYTNKRSFNLYADSILRSLAVAGGMKGTAENGVIQVKNFLTRLNIDTTDFDVFDGSGISRDDIATCSDIVALLEAVLKQPYKDAFVSSLPVAGDPADIGNMSKRLTQSPAARNALVKTGYLDRARAHAGYVKDAQGRNIIFCVISNNFNGGFRDVDAAHEALINALAGIGLNAKPVRIKP